MDSNQDPIHFSYNQPAERGGDDFWQVRCPVGRQAPGSSEQCHGCQATHSEWMAEAGEKGWTPQSTGDLQAYFQHTNASTIVFRVTPLQCQHVHHAVAHEHQQVSTKITLRSVNQGYVSLWNTWSLVHFTFLELKWV